MEVGAERCFRDRETGTRQFLEKSKAIEGEMPLLVSRAGLLSALILRVRHCAQLTLAVSSRIGGSTIKGPEGWIEMSLSEYGKGMSAKRRRDCAGHVARKRHIFFILAALTVSIGLFSCQNLQKALKAGNKLAATGEVADVDKWPFESKALKISYKADQDLNRNATTNHTLFVCIYQLNDPNAFNGLRVDNAGLVKLLECKRFGESVASSEGIVIHPGDEGSMVFDRAEGTRFVGIVAGYYNMWPEHVSKLVLVPVKIQSSGFLIKKKVAVPGKLVLKLFFGPEEIQQILE